MNTNVSISMGNSKMGAIPSVSLPAIKTCANCGCARKCYAAKLERLRPTVKEAYARNLDILTSKPGAYWLQVRAAACVSRFFRFHVSGDIVNMEYMREMIKTAADLPATEFLCFTKRYDIVNAFIDAGGVIPENLHLLFSGWQGYPMSNPYSLPEAHVIYRDGTTTARDGAVLCTGNCTECAVHDSGCWALEAGQQVVFMEH